MKVKVQVVTITDDGQETTKEIACVERHDLTPETFGLSLAEGKAVLQALQEVVVEWQMHAYLQQQHACPHCGKARRSKGVHHGLRASEVSLLHREDLNMRQGRIYIPRVKGSIAKTSPLQPEDLRRLQAYLRTRRDDAPSLFISTRGIPLERRSYWDLMQKYGEQAGLPKAKRRFHALRHAIAVHLLDAGADVAFVQDRLGHANIQNTILYMRYTTATRDAHTRHLFASPHVV